MNTQRQPSSLFLIMVTVAMMAAITNLTAGPLKVNSAEPNVGIQSETLEVTIKGQGFSQAKGVRFLVTGTSDTGRVNVTFVDAPDDETILTSVVIADDATVADYDIEVQLSSGRKGKGTSKFSVQAQSPGNMQFETCNQVFFPDDETGPCKSVDGGECELLLGNPPNIKRMMTDCTTTKTLVLPDEVLLTSASAQESVSDRKTLKAINWEGGAAVITNAGHRAQLGNINIEIDTAAADGCDGALLSAVSFVLHNKTAGNPYPNKATEPPYDPADQSTYDRMASTFHVDGVYVNSLGGPLCNAVELIRDPSYTAAYPEPQYLNINDWKVRVTGGRIEPGTYVDTAVSLQGIKQQQDINPPTVSGNAIFAPGCVTGDPAAFGIVHGPLIARDNAVPYSEALLENNTIIMSNSDCDTVGIVLLGGTDTKTTGDINSNYIDGATYGVVIDGNVHSVNLKGNTLTGDIGVSAVGICSAIPFSEKGKPNQVNGFSTPKADDCSP